MIDLEEGRQVGNTGEGLDNRDGEKVNANPLEKKKKKKKEKKRGNGLTEFKG